MSDDIREIAMLLPDEVINNRNLALIDEVLSDDFVDHEELPPGIPPGKEAPKILFGMMLEAFPDMHATVNHLLVDGDMVTMHMTWSGTHEGEFMGIPATGNTFSINVIDINQIIDGQVVAHWGVMDQMSMMQQLGVMG